MRKIPQSISPLSTTRKINVEQLYFVIREICMVFPHKLWGFVCSCALALQQSIALLAQLRTNQFTKHCSCGGLLDKYRIRHRQLSVDWTTPRIYPWGSNLLRKFRLPSLVPTPYELLDYGRSTLSHKSRRLWTSRSSRRLINVPHDQTNRHG